LLAGLAIAAPAFADVPGVDMTANRICPGDVGASSDGGVMNCAAVKTAGLTVLLLSTFNPAEPVADLAGIDGRVDIALVGDLNSSATFWNAAGCNNTIAFIATRPATGCTSPLIEAAAAGAYTPNVGTSTEQLFYSLSNSTTQAVNTGDHIFAFRLNLDPNKSSDNPPGTCTGCQVPVCLTHAECTPASFNGDPTTTLTSSGHQYPGVSNSAQFNGGCAAVPTRARTWGQLKSLYR